MTKSSLTSFLARGKLLSRESNLKRLYGITVEQYDNMLEGQNNACAVCKRHTSNFKTRLCVDHDHKSGEIRGLLCHYCNHRLVGRHRDPELLRTIADYISQGTGLFVPAQFKTGRKKPRKKKKIDKDSST